MKIKSKSRVGTEEGTRQYPSTATATQTPLGNWMKRSTETMLDRCDVDSALDIGDEHLNSIQDLTTRHLLPTPTSPLSAITQKPKPSSQPTQQLHSPPLTNGKESTSDKGKKRTYDESSIDWQPSDALSTLRLRDTTQHRGNHGYLTQTQRNMKLETRNALVNAILAYARPLNFLPSSVTLTVHLLDRYLSLVSVPHKTQQDLVMRACIFIAGKYNEETNEPLAAELCANVPQMGGVGASSNDATTGGSGRTRKKGASNNATTTTTTKTWQRNDLRRMERKVLSQLGFCVASVLPQEILDELFRCLPPSVLPTLPTKRRKLSSKPMTRSASKHPERETAQDGSIHALLIILNPIILRLIWNTEYLKFHFFVIAVASVVTANREGYLHIDEEAWKTLLSNLADWDQITQCVTLLMNSKRLN